MQRKKCGILSISRTLSGSIDGIPVVDSYRYSGVDLDHNLSLKLHFIWLKNRVMYLINHVSFVTAELDLKFRIYMEELYVKCYFVYLVPLIPFNLNTYRIKSTNFIESLSRLSVESQKTQTTTLSIDSLLHWKTTKKLLLHEIRCLANIFVSSKCRIEINYYCWIFCTFTTFRTDDVTIMFNRSQKPLHKFFKE